MANDLMGELGLDVESLKKSLNTVEQRLGGLEKSVTKTDKAVQGGFVKGMKEAARALGLAFGSAAIIRYIYNLKNLGREMDEIRKKRIAGTEADAQFKADTKGAGGAAGVMRGIGLLVERAALKMGIAAAQSVAGIALAIEDASNFVRSMFDQPAVTTVRDSIKKGEDIQFQEEKIKGIEDDISKLRDKDSITMEGILAIKEREIDLETEKANLALLMAEDGRETLNQSKERIAQLGNEKKLLEDQHAIELERERGTTNALAAELTGHKDIAAQERIRVQFQERIAQAIREGKHDLAAQLQLQRDLQREQAMADEHALTPKQLRDARKQERERERGIAKQKAREKDMQDRERRQKGEAGPSAIDELWKRMPAPGHMQAPGHVGDIPAMIAGPGGGQRKATPGSRMDRFQRRKAMEAQGVDPAKMDSANAAMFYTIGLAQLKDINLKLGNAFVNQ